MESLGPEDVDAVRHALIRLLAIADRLDARNAQTVQRLDAAAAALDHGVRRLDQGGDRFADSALQLIGENAQETIAHGAGQALGDFRQQLQQSADLAKSAAQSMDEQRKGMTSARRSLVWNGMIALLIGSLLAAGAAAWMVHRSMQDMAQADFGQDILQATQRGAITRCGESLCVRVGSNPQHYGKDGQYRLLQD
jgi:hypothetical protein